MQGSWGFDWVLCSGVSGPRVRIDEFSPKPKTLNPGVEVMKVLGFRLQWFRISEFKVSFSRV